MAAIPKAHIAHFPATVKNVLVVVSDMQDPRATAVTLAAMAARGAIRIHLLSIQSPPSSHAGFFLRSIAFRKMQRQAAFEALDPLRSALESLGIAYRVHVATSPWLPTIARYARDIGCASVVVGDNPRHLLHRLVLRHDCWRIRTFLQRSGRDCLVVQRDTGGASVSHAARGAPVAR